MPSTLKKSLAVAASLVAVSGCAETTPAPTRPAAPAAHAETSVAAVQPGRVVTNSVGMRLVEVPAGEFLMGSPHSDRDALFSERPRHRVRISRPFLIGAHELTREQYQRVTGEDPSEFQPADASERAALPVERVTWNEATAFCQMLSELPEELEAGRRYRLPTEAEWEYACRAGTETRYSFGDELKRSQANFNNADQGTMPVGSFPPNAFGLSDMHGNVWEWCADWYSSHFYEEARELEVDPLCRHPSSVNVGYRSVRGGGWIDLGASSCRSAERRYYEPSERHAYVGFRVVCPPPVN